jgi:hypothetical protein
MRAPAFALAVLLAAPCIAREDAATAAKATEKPAIGVASQPAIAEVSRPLGAIDKLAREDLRVLLLITPDADWKEKWATPREHSPEFSSSDTVALGGTLMVLGFVSNPGRDADGNVDVRCDVVMVRPDGTRAIDQEDIECLSGPGPEHPHDLAMTYLKLGFEGEASDPPGRYVIEYVLHDRVRGVTLPLRVAFTYTK